MGMVASDPALRAKLAEVMDKVDGRVRQLEQELAGARRERDALAALVDKPGPVLSGDSLRAEAYKLLKEVDPEQKGVHYQKITQMLLDRGFQISGVSADKAPNVRSTIGAGARAAKMFQSVGRDDGNYGLYTWG